MAVREGPAERKGHRPAGPVSGLPAGRCMSRLEPFPGPVVRSGPRREHGAGVSPFCVRAGPALARRLRAWRPGSYRRPRERNRMATIIAARPSTRMTIPVMMLFVIMPPVRTSPPRTSQGEKIVQRPSSGMTQLTP